MSIKRDLYEFVKTAIFGGTFTNCLSKEYVLPGIKDGAENKIKHYMFWNSELINPDQKDNYPNPSVFFEYSNSENVIVQQRISETYDRSNTKDLTEFTLHVIVDKARSKDRDEDYLEQIDLADEIYNAIQGKSFAGVKNINRIREGS